MVSIFFLFKVLLFHSNFGFRSAMGLIKGLLGNACLLFPLSSGPSTAGWNLAQLLCPKDCSFFMSVFLSPLGTRDQFHARQFFHRLGLGEAVSG